MPVPIFSSKLRNSSSEMSAMRMLISSANCARMPPADLLVDPLPRVSRSQSTTSVTPSCARWYAVLVPMAPPPTITT